MVLYKTFKRLDGLPVGIIWTGAALRGRGMGWAHVAPRTANPGSPKAGRSRPPDDLYKRLIMNYLEANDRV